jgi:hypothetical protein
MEEEKIGKQKNSLRSQDYDMALMVKEVAKESGIGSYNTPEPMGESEIKQWVGYLSNPEIRTQKVSWASVEGPSGAMA